ncbi:MAG: ABC transporter permease [Candidatus Levyibacteriota bacterium]
MHYLKILKALIVINTAYALEYKAHFVAQVFASLAWGVFSVVNMILLTYRVHSAFGWSRNELILLSVMVNVVYGIHRMLFDVNFWRFSRIIHYGEMDMVLLKPVDSQFQMSMWIIDISGIFRFLVALALTFILVFAMHFPISLTSVLIATILSLAGVVLLYAFTYIFLTLTIWFSNLSNLMGLVNNILSMSRYPKEMYEGLGTYFFFFLLPLIVIISTPTKALIQKGNLLDSLLLVLFTILFFAISRVFWKFALRFYVSASG